MADTTGSSWDLLNYVGELFSASPTRTPFLTLIGGMNGAAQSDSFEFPLSVEYELPAAGQNVRSEDDSVTAPDPVDVTVTQQTNICQIMQYAVLVTYKALSNSGRLSGIARAGKLATIQDWLDFQITQKLKVMARDTEYSFINGSYVACTASSDEAKTRGILEAVSSNTVACSGADFSDDLLDALLKEMADNGASFQDCVIFVNAFQKQQITDTYLYVPTDRRLGGGNIQAIETDFAMLGVVYNPFMPTDTLLVAEMTVCQPVVQPVPKKGLIFYEDLAKQGAAERGQLYGQVGLDYGPEWMHGTLTGLSTS